MSKKVIVLGNGITGAKAVLELKKVRADWDISIIGYDGRGPFSQETFSKLLRKEIKPAQVIYQSEDSYQKAGINLITDQPVTRINLKRKKIHTEQRGQLDFDVLIVTGLPEYRLPDIKGNTKSNLFGIKTFRDIESVSKLLPLIDVVTVQSDSWQGLNLAFIINELGREVYFMGSTKSSLYQTLPAEVWRALDDHMEQFHFHFLWDQEMAEALGDADVKALRLGTGKVIASDIVMSEGVRPDFRVFSDEEMVINKSFPMKSTYTTDLEGVYVIEDEPDLSLAELEQRGTSASAEILGQPVSEQTSEMEVRTIETKHVSIQFIGQWRTGQAESVDFFDKDQLKFQKMFGVDGKLTGAILVNCGQSDQMDKIIKAVEGGQSMAEIRPIFSLPIPEPAAADVLASEVQPAS